MHALDHLTEDCWKEILKRVKDPKDLWSCSEACLTFQEILRKKRNQFMFDLILPVIKEYLPAPNPDPDDEEAQWKALLKCRLVCKSWCKSIDKRRDAEDERVFEHRYWFRSGEETDRFLQHFSTHAGNPFLGRSVVLFLRSPLLLVGNPPEALNAHGDDEAFHVRKLRELLDRFGNQIWTLKMFEQIEDGHDPNDANLSLCKNIQTVLGHLPNLRGLELLADVDGLRGGNTAEQKLPTYIAANPLPDLPQLEHLEVSGVNVGMIRFILVKCAPMLSSLALDDPSGFPEEGLQMPNLKTLEFTQLDATTSLRALRELQAPQLGSLALTLDGNRDNVDVWPIDELFRNIQHLPIQSLEMNADDGEVFLGESAPITPEQRPYNGSISSIFLNSPYSPGSASFNFLLYCPQLTRVVLKHRSQGNVSGHPKGVPELLDVRDKLEQNERDFYQSDIWDHLPLLEHLTIVGVYGGGYHRRWGRDDYDREEYEEMKRGD